MSRALFAVMIFVAFASGQQPQTSAHASLEGRVTDTDGHPLHKAGLTLRAAGPAGAPSPSPYTATSDAEGKFSFDEIEPGSYTLTVERAGYLRKLYRATPRETFSTFTLAPGQRLRQFDLALTRAVTVSGRVLDEDGDPVANAPVQLLQRTWQSGLSPVAPRNVSTDQSGKYSLPDLSAGRYYLSAGMGRGSVFSILGMRAINGPTALSGSPATPGERSEYYATTFYPSEIDQSSAKEIQILAGPDNLQGYDIRLRKTPAFRVRGKVVGTIPGHPIDQCQVVLTPAGLPSGMGMGLGLTGTVAHLAKDGSLDFPGWRFPPGDYFVIVTSTLQGWPILLAHQPLVIADRDIDDAVLNLQPLVELRGSIALEGQPQTDFSTLPGTPAPSVTLQVGLDPADVRSMNNLRSKIGNDGSFRIADIAPGAYEVQVWGIPDGTWVKSIRLGPRDARDGRIEIPAAVSPQVLQITLSRSVAQIAGIVETDKGKPADGGAVTLISDPPGAGKASMMTGISRDGRFTLSQVPPGTYRLYAWDDLETAQHYDPEFLKPWERDSFIITVEENGHEQVTLKQIPADNP